MLNQGRLEDCSVVATIILLACHWSRGAPLLGRLLAGYEPEEGRCRVRLFLGAWEEVVVDTLLPCLGGSPAFARSRDGEEIYACLVEKAYAKACGSYRAIRGSHVGEVLRDLTGAPVEEVRLVASPPPGPPQLWSLWERLRRHHGDGDLIACSHASPDGRVAELPNGHGVMTNHAYAVVELATPRSAPEGTRLLRIRNPWARSEWTGSWGAFSEDWTDEARRELGYDGSDGAGFWVELSQFARTFNRLHICRACLLRGPGAGLAGLTVEPSPETAGGCANFDTFYRNQMFRLALPPSSQPLEVLLVLSQRDPRRGAEQGGPGARRARPAQMGLTLLAQHFAPDVPTDALCCTKNRWEILQTTPFVARRDVCLCCELAPLPERREYRLVPSCYFPDELCAGALLLHAYWREPEGRGGSGGLSLERAEAEVRSSASLPGRFFAGDPLFGGPLAHQPCYRVVARAPPVRISVLLLQAPERLARWATEGDDPLVVALGALHAAFCAEGVLGRGELRALLAAAGGDGGDGGGPGAEEVYADLGGGDRGVALGQFLARSKALLAALRLPDEDLVPRLWSLVSRGACAAGDAGEWDPLADPADAQRGAGCGGVDLRRVFRGNDLSNTVCSSKYSKVANTVASYCDP